MYDNLIVGIHFFLWDSLVQKYKTHCELDLVYTNNIYKLSIKKIFLSVITVYLKISNTFNIKSPYCNTLVIPTLDSHLAYGDTFLFLLLLAAQLMFLTSSRKFYSMFLLTS